MNGKQNDVTSMLTAISAGDHAAKKKLFSLLYKELHNLAHAAMRREHPGNILQTTALIHETYIRLVKNKNFRMKNRSHFFTVAAKAMRRILVDVARARRAAKRGGGRMTVSLEKTEEPEEKPALPESPFKNLEMLDRALKKLEKDEDNQRRCTILELHFFAGLTIQQTAEVLGISARTVKRDWEFVKVWLYQELKKSESGSG